MHACIDTNLDFDIAHCVFKVSYSQLQHVLEAAV